MGTIELTRRATAAWATALVTSLAMSGCGGNGNQGAMTADLERDLQMAVSAQRPRTMVVSVIEGGPTGGPSGDARGRRDNVPVRQKAPRPTPQAEEVQEVAALPELDMSAAPAVAVTERVESAPAPIPEPSIEAPSPDIGAMAAGGPSAGNGDGEGTARRGGGWGTAIGAIIRGASVGVDNCGPHDRNRRPPNTTGGIGVMGPMIPSMGGAIGGVIGGVMRNPGAMGNGGGGMRRAGPRW